MDEKIPKAEVPEETPEGVFNSPEKEQPEGYDEVFKLKKELYDEAIKRNPEMKEMLFGLENHERIVLEYGDELIKAHPNLSSEEKVAARLAIILHDTGKMELDGKDSNILDHHKIGADNAEAVLTRLRDEGVRIGGIEISDEIIAKVREAIDRHMNHPYLVKAKGELFPEPQDDIDKIVYDADMMANVGFKNVGRRLLVVQNLREDLAYSEKNGITFVEAPFHSVREGEEVGEAMPGIKTGYKYLDRLVKSEPAKKKIEALIADAEAIFERLKENNVFEEIEEEFPEKAKPGWETRGLKAKLNDEILKAAEELGIDYDDYKNLMVY